MRKLIVSLDTYSWVKYCSGLIMREPSDFVVMIIQSDDSPITDFPDLCEEAVLEQRRADLFNIGKRLGIKKLNNLMYDEIEVSKLSAQLQLQIAIGGVEEIYFQNDPTLYNLFVALKKSIGIDIFCYGMKDYDMTVQLNDFEHREKLSLTELIVAVGLNDDITGFEQIEYFKRVVQ